jgi:DDE superfamily endonuclease
MQDGAPIHKAKSTTRWLKLHGVKMFNGGIWPAQSPDMNPIEHLWPVVARALQGRTFSSRDALWTAIEAEFQAISPAFIQNLYSSIPRRLFAVIGAKGGHTKY